MMNLGKLAREIGCELEGDPEIEIAGVGPIDSAGPTEVSFVANERYVSKLQSSRAAAVIVGYGVEVPRRPVLRSPHPYLAFVRALDLFFEPHRPALGIHPTAVIAPGASIGERASVGPYAVIGEGCRIGDDARIDAHVVIYPGVEIGDRFVAHAGAVVRERTLIGHEVRLQAGAVIGGDGFGYIPLEDGRIRSIPQAGRVVLEDGVEIGANATVDRATVGETRIRRGAKIDNLVMVAHGCDIGEGVFLAAQVGLAGSTRIGAGAQLGGQSGAVGHLSVGEGARVAAQAGITNDLPSGGEYGGFPAIEIHKWRRAMVAMKWLPGLFRRLRRIERRLGLESGEDGE